MDTIRLMLPLALSLFVVAVVEGAKNPTPEPIRVWQQIHRKNVTEKVSDKQGIIGGKDSAEPYPFMCSLWNDNYFTCGAILYNENTILTAPHCVDGALANQLSVICGDFKLNQFTDTEQFRTVLKIKMHPKYDVGPGFVPNDVALLRVSLPFDLNDNVNVAPPIPVRGNKVPKACKLIGFGVTETGFISYSLKEVGINRIGKNVCKNYWGSVVTGKNICFVNTKEKVDMPKDASACNGDSGGPATCGDYLVGVTSFGAKGCPAGIPSVYAKLQAYKRWIDRNAF